MQKNMDFFCYLSHTFLLSNSGGKCGSGVKVQESRGEKHTFLAVAVAVVVIVAVAAAWLT